MKTIKKWPRLYGKARTGKIKVIDFSVLQDGDTFIIHQEHGQLNGKMTVNERKITKGKNIGRSNETTPEQQAIAEAQSKFQKKLDQNYNEDINKAGTGNLLPMKCHKYKVRGKEIKWPAYVQPKLNGVRCIAEKASKTENRYISKSGKSFTTLKHLDPFIDFMLTFGERFDGEIYHPDLSLQQIVSLLRADVNVKDNVDYLQYWVYDMAIEDWPFDLRNKSYQKKTIAPEAFGKSPIVAVPSYLVKDEKEMLEYHAKFTSQGYEGTIIRNVNGMYLFGYNSVDLQKYKDYEDDEFEIVGGKEGKGKEEGAVIFRCKTKDGKEFDVRPCGTLEYRQQMWKDLPKLIGKDLTVRYQEITPDGIPFHLRGLIVRDYE